MSYLNGSFPDGSSDSRDRGPIVEPAFSHEETMRIIKWATICLVSLISITCVGSWIVI
ncbi:hypothetical protein R9C00_20720 [Flammeovirgaceae bacterium SG7u.111]|nr:hypothetical protein [Flammeovirgaceae bacterium SG7u.132]WPO34126.1 hypothetical protein R9C00_20720 [Flammeovirgaceae bacterium SG7u.111]